MRIPINPHSQVPLYQQIEAYLRQSILSGALEAGTRLPASRQLSQELGVSRVTVENAYAVLEADGLVGRRVGSGSYVLTPEPGLPSAKPAGSPTWPRWQQELRQGRPLPPPQPAPDPARRPHPRPIVFTGFGDPRRFPVKEFLQAIKAVAQRDGATALHISEAQGYAPLRETIAHILSSQGIQTRAESILITSGSQQALALIARVLLEPGDAVVVESPTYNTALELFRAQGIRLIGCPIDRDGMQVDRLEAILQQSRPKLIYTIPTFQNPSGVCLSSANRRKLAALASRHNVPILEDDFAGDLRYEGRDLPALKALDAEGNVIYVGTFSKILMPGLRIGFIVADGPVRRWLIEEKRMYDLATSSLMQRALEEYVTVGRYQAHIRRSCQAYRRRREAMLAAIRQHLPQGVKADSPQGGLFIWLELPDGLSADALLPLAFEEGATYAPGSWFFPDPADGARYLRLNFAVQTPEDIDEGIQRLARAIRRFR